ncbi:MAG: substrate binding domain-containing protein, partial [Methyloligellaceae bacterium]
DSTLIVRKIFEMRRIICATPAYLAQHGTPNVPNDLKDHNCILMQNMPHLHQWPFRKGGEVIHVQTGGDIKTDNADIMFDLAVAGHGIIRMIDLQLRPAIDDGRLVPLLTSHHVDEPTPVWSVTPPGRQRIPRVRALIDFLVTQLGAPEKKRKAN